MTKANKFIVAIAVTAFMMGAVTLPSVTILYQEIATMMATIMIPVSVACLAGTVIAVALCKDKKFSVAGMILAAAVAFLSVGLWTAVIVASEFANLYVSLSLDVGSYIRTSFISGYTSFSDLFPICVVGIAFTVICLALAFFAPLVANASDTRGRLGISPVFAAAVAVFVIINIACSAFFDLNAHLELPANGFDHIDYGDAVISGSFIFPMYMCTNISVLFLFLVASVSSVFVRSDAVRKAVETPIIYVCAITMTILILVSAEGGYGYPIVLPIPAYWFVAIAYTVLRLVPRVNAALSGAYGGKDKDPAPAVPQQTAAPTRHNAPAQPQLVQPPQPQRARPAQPVRSRYAQPAPTAQPQRRQPPPRYVTPPVQSPQPQYAQPQYVPPEQPQYVQPQYAPPQRRQTPPRYAPPSGEYANAAPPDIRRQPSQRPSASAPEVRGEEAAVRNDGTDERNDAR